MIPSESTTELLHHLKRLNIRVWAENGQLGIQAPKGTLTTTLRQTLAERKSEILQFLTGAEARRPDDSAPILPVERNAPLPASLSQERLWFLWRLEPDNLAYNIFEGLRLRGGLEADLLERSIQEIVRRHEALRTTFDEVDGMPVQVVAPNVEFNLGRADLLAASASERESEGRRLAIEECRRPFDLRKGPLFRAFLIRLSDDDHILVTTFHHIITDGWSLGVIRSELEALYAAFQQGRPSSLPELPIQYADFAVWQRERLQGDGLASQWEYWRKQLQGGLPALQLTTDRPRPPVQTHRGAALPFEVPPEMFERLSQLALHNNATVFMALIAAFKILLFRYTGQTDFGVGIPIANRTRPELENLIGFFVNTLVLRTDLSGNPSFLEILDRVRTTTLGAYQHPDMPFEKLVHELKPPRDMSRSPLFQVMFVFQNFPEPTVGESGLTITPVDLDSGAAMFDLTVYAWEDTGRLRGVFEYNSDLFDATTIERLAGHYTNLLADIVRHPDLEISLLALLTPVEHRRITEDWNATEHPLPDATLVDLFEAQAAHSPAAPATLYRGEPMSYAELDRRSAQLADHLAGLGIGPESLVGIWMDRTPELIVALLGTLRAGGAYVPLDPSYPRERLRFMLEDARAPVLLTEERFLAALPPFAGTVVCLDRDRDAIASAAPAVRRRATPDQPCYAIYTSGSTGTPKGVLGLHRGAVNRLRWMWRTFPFAPGETACQKTYLSFVDSVWEIFGPLLHGVPSVLIPEEAVRDPRRLTAELAAGRVSRIVLVPSLLRVMLEESDHLAAQLPQLRLWVTSGEALTPDLARLFRERLPQARLVNLYGSSEVSADVTFHEVALEDLLGEIPIGRPIDNSQLYVLDAGMHPVPVGVTGELYVGGASLARGYLHRPDLTAERFVPGPFRENQRLFRTGDLVRYRPDGRLLFVGRRDQQVKVRGVRVELGEVEAALRAHPAVKAAAAAAWPGADGGARLIGYAAVDPAAAPSVGDLQAFLRARLPETMVPSGFRLMDALPLTPSGKIDRRALPRDVDTAAAPEARSVPAADALERQLLELWRAVLKSEQVGVTDDFFAAGGHSLLAARLFSRIEKSLGLNLPLSALFEAPTVARLAEVIRTRRWRSEWSSLVPIRATGTRPPLFLVHGAGGNVLLYRELADRLGPEQPVYGLQCRGLDGRSPHAGSFAAMASEYLREVRSVQPDGPYYLGGYCLGGAIALEMAQQLTAEGRAVALVAMIETYNFHTAPELPLYYGLLHKLQNLKFHWENLHALSWGERRAFLGTKTRTEWERLKLSTAIALGRVARALHLPWDERYPHLNVARLNDAAHAAYAPRPYPGAITLFRPRRHYAGYDETDFGWGAVALGGVEVRELPVYPRGSLVRPFVDLLAQALTECLQSSQNARAAESEAAIPWLTGAEAHATARDGYRWCGHH